MENEYPQEIQDVINQIKEQNNLKTVYVIEAEGENGEINFAYLRKPSFATQKSVLNVVRKTEDITQAGEIIFTDCYVGGVDMMADDDLKMIACLAAAQLLEVKPATLKKS
jgi:hypothetical protein